MPRGILETIPFPRNIIGVCILSLLCVSQTAQAAFYDVPDSHPYADAIYYLLKNNIVEGYEDRSFQPARALNRAEFAKILVTMLYPKEYIDTCLEDVGPGSEVIPGMSFPDVPENAWFAPSVCVAWSNGIITGYPDGWFRPEEGINFAEAAKMLAIGFDLTGLELPNLGGTLNAEWYRPYAEFLSAAKAIPPSIETYVQPVNRGELAEMLYRLKDIDTALEPVDRFSLTKEDIDVPVTWKTYENRKYGFQIDYPNVWPEPHPVPRGTFDGKSPYTRSSWTVYLGPPRSDCPALNECVERELWIDGYDPDLATQIIDDIENDEFFIELIDQKTINGLPMLWTMEEVGECVDERVFFFGEEYVYVLNGLCAGDNDKLHHMMERLAQGFFEIEIPYIEY